MRYTEQLAATVSKRYRTAGARFFYLESIPAAAQVTVAFYSKDVKLPEEIVAVTGGWWAAFAANQPGVSPNYDEVEITSTQTGTAVFHISKGGVGSNVFSGSVTATISKPATIDTVADVALGAGAATQILPADATRQKAYICNLSTNAAVMRIGDVNVGAARGAEVQPGQSIPLEGTEAIYGYSVPGEAVAVTIIKD